MTKGAGTSSGNPLKNTDLTLVSDATMKNQQQFLNTMGDVFRKNCR